MSARTRQAAEQATLALPFRVPPQEWFTLRQAGAVLGLAESTVEKLYDKGELTGHRHNAGRGERDHKRVPRAALIAYLIRTADYTDESFADLYCAALPHLPAATLLRIARQANRLAIEQPLSR
ncbi:MAG: helix-turn-helix domain-containing protein [Verrucomicrobia bacterium]|nr:helix-turn-helix domain-containing protein [Verrucomicrobiota bacterium]